MKILKPIVVVNGSQVVMDDVIKLLDEGYLVVRASGQDHPLKTYFNNNESGKKVFIVNSENKHAESIIHKICFGKNGEIIFATDEEFRALETDVKMISS